MAGHWTYRPGIGSDTNLEQGDFLEPTDRLTTVLDEVHPHFKDPKYLGFLVLTQSCDLVRRKKGLCSASHINICVVRPIEQVLFRLLNAVCTPYVDGVYAKTRHGEARNLIERILNQNEQALGLFYLYPDADIGLQDHAVAILRVSIALRPEHYDVLLDARRGGLNPEFAAKLGWLVGNLYSRVGTQDWSSPSDRKDRQEEIVADLVCKEGNREDRPVWVEDAAIAEARKRRDTPPATREEAIALLKECRPEEPLETVIKAARSEIQKVQKGAEPPVLTDQVVETILNRLRNNSVIGKFARQGRDF